MVFDRDYTRKLCASMIHKYKRERLIGRNRDINLYLNTEYLKFHILKSRGDNLFKVTISTGGNNPITEQFEAHVANFTIANLDNVVLEFEHQIDTYTKRVMEYKKALAEAHGNK